jgi:arylsulfatase A-like enzyme
MQIKHLIPLLGLFFLFACKQPTTTTIKKQKTNIIYVLTDDLGWKDLSCYGSTFYETPNIDELANQGMRFTNAYAPSSVCSPSRASILTGKTPARLHLTDWIAGLDYPYEKLSPPKDWIRYLPHEEITIAERLKEAGYKTFMAGKWHLGRVQHNPLTQGFDEKVGGGPAGGPGSYFYPYRNVPNLEEGMQGEYLTDRLTSEVISWMNMHKDTSFFIYLAYFNPHRPTQAKEEYIEKFKTKTSPGQAQNNPVNAGMIYSLDENMGRLMDALNSLNLASNTLLIFNSDNGGNHYADTPQKTSNAPLREGKGSNYEGGIRVPLIMRWPDKIKAGQTSDIPVVGFDFYPTLLNLAGLHVSENKTVDGVNLLPLLTDNNPPQRKALYFHYPHYHHGGAEPHGVIRKGAYKLILFYDGFDTELYNIKDDIRESNDISEKYPDIVKELTADLKQWLNDTGAQMPTQNPDYDPKRRDEWKFHLEEELW